jgi:cell division protease FtsH
MGGRAAEELLFHEVTGGASTDFEKANQIATTMVTKWGMGRDPDSKDDGTSGRGSLSFLVARPNGSLPSEVQPAATRAMRAILDEAYAAACSTLIDNMTVLRRIAAYLVEHERVDGDTFDALFAGSHHVPNAESEWRPAASRPRAWAEIAPFLDRRNRPIQPIPAAPGPGEAPAGGGLTTPIPGLLLPVPVPAAATPVPSLAGRVPPVRPVSDPPRRPRSRGLFGGLRGRRPLGQPAAATTSSGRLERRLRALAAGYLRQAGSWLESEAEADR